jgi:hypothetical protein
MTLLVEAPTLITGEELATIVREFTAEDDLPGDEILPGFSVPVASLFDV